MLRKGNKALNKFSYDGHDKVKFLGLQRGKKWNKNALELIKSELVKP